MKNDKRLVLTPEISDGERRVSPGRKLLILLGTSEGSQFRDTNSRVRWNAAPRRAADNTDPERSRRYLSFHLTQDWKLRNFTANRCNLNLCFHTNFCGQNGSPRMLRKALS